ncbi:uncharacterized protein E0L32_008027 [Thyridium curvatum]|uniref:Uncharacterized protein n=1 Tax=Thyridium curvatum TaxID=1093900 RepID=A0A507B334_9PEZI|nr:uncharacterized protein E0L32_008027 [Thyridium curvatum]TPX10990.1 hypothetical protein E0L32_008027 [Thyridium curvatum]
MAISWGTIKSLTLFFGPILVPKAISYYRSVRSAPGRHGLAVRPCPEPTRRAILLLALCAAILLVRSLPVFAPENVFVATQSRLQAPTDVLFNRLSALRAASAGSPDVGGAAALTPADEALRARFVNLESRLLYAQFGPDPLSTCPFCSSDDPRSYLYYAAPALVAPHLVNLAVLALATAASPAIFGRDARSHGAPTPSASGWRSTATLAACALAAADIYLVSSYSHQLNARALRLADVDFFFWRARARRLLALAALDALAAALLWLTATNRAFASPPTPAARLESVSRALAVAKSRLSAAGIVKNTAARDEDLRGRSQAYWAHEGRLMREVMEEREVVEGVNDALANRIDIGTITRDAEAYAASVIEPLQPPVG